MSHVQGTMFLKQEEDFREIIQALDEFPRQQMMIIKVCIVINGNHHPIVCEISEEVGILKFMLHDFKRKTNDTVYGDKIREQREPSHDQ